MFKKLLGEHAGVFFSIVFAMLAVALAFGAAQQRINANHRDIQQLDNIQRADHDILLAIERDVRWIRSQITHDHDDVDGAIGDKP